MLNDYDDCEKATDKRMHEKKGNTLINYIKGVLRIFL